MRSRLPPGRQAGEAGQAGLEQRAGPAVEAGAGHDVVARAGEGGEGQQLGRLAAGGGQRPETALEAGHALLERRHRRVADPAVDVAVLLQREEVRRIGGVLEDEARVW